MFFKPKRKEIARCDSTEIRELQNFNEPLEMHYLDKPTQKEINLFSKKNYSYVDNRKITIIKDSVIFIKL